MFPQYDFKYYAYIGKDYDFVFLQGEKIFLS